MLVELSVRNVAVFTDALVAFAPGLTVVTGETGSGKSLLVEALRLCLGEKPDPSAVRTGAPEAEVSARFELDGRDDVAELLEEHGFPFEEEIVVRRIVPVAGRSRAFLNGRMATQGLLSALSPLLVEMVSQHAVHDLLSKRAALSALDAFAGSDGKAREMRQRFRDVSARRRNLEEIQAKSATARDRAEAIDFQVRELEGAALVLGEEEALAAELTGLRNAGKVREALCAADEALSGPEGSATAALSFAAARLREASAADPRLVGIGERLKIARAEIDDVAADVAKKAASVERDEERVEEAESRLSTIRRLKRKHGMEVAELVSLLETLKGERDGLQHLFEEEKAVEADLRVAEGEAVSLGASLSEARRAVARKMATALAKEAAKVGLPGARFEVALVSREPAAVSLSSSGFDDADFLFSANPGQDLRPLASTASGGELSRVMLSLRNASASPSARKTLLFDEIDTGIGGKVASQVGARLHALSAGNQVVVVTHLPQVAAFADVHLAVEKRQSGKTVETGVTSLSKQDRMKELARMISGVDLTDEALGHARELIEKAKE